MKNTLKRISIILLLSSLFMLTNTASSTVSAITDFDSNRYLGTWYEVARLPMYFERHCQPPIIARYRLDPENPQRIIVSNSCPTSRGMSMANGIAEFVAAPTVAKLTVTFLPAPLRWLPFTRGDYWVLATDYTGYALVGSPNHKYLWILSRAEKPELAQVRQLVRVAQAQGFAVDEMIFQ